MKSWKEIIIIFSLFMCGAILYTWPSALAIGENSQTLFMSDGSDPTGMPYLYEKIHLAFLENPLSVFNGAVSIPNLAFPEGSLIWSSAIEKLAGAFLPFAFPFEQIGPVSVLIFMIMNGLCFYYLSRSFGWDRMISIALGLAWAFSPFTRARAQVHPTLVAIYAFPLCLLALNQLAKQPLNRKTIAFAAMAFFVSALSPQYYIVFLCIVSPLWFIYFILQIDTGLKVIAIRNLGIALVPAVAFLAFSTLHPAPASVLSKIKNVYPVTGDSNTWPHPFLSIFSAQILDYSRGDIAIANAFDLNPIKNFLNNDFRTHLQMGNYHEHAVGIRWVILICAMAGIFLFSKQYRLLIRKEKILYVFLIVLGVFCLFSSFSPDWGYIWGPSAWIHKIVPQIRTPNRIGILVHFSLLLLSGFFIHQLTQISKFKQKSVIISAVFLFLVFVEFPPLVNAMPMQRIFPSRAEQFSTVTNNCGPGYRFPHISGGGYETIEFYYLLQTLRGTPCSILNPTEHNDRDQKMAQLFSYQNVQSMQAVGKNDSNFRRKLLRFANCNHLQWIIFDQRATAAFTRDFCSEWNGQWVQPDLCLKSNQSSATLTSTEADYCVDELQHD